MLFRSGYGNGGSDYLPSGAWTQADAPAGPNDRAGSRLDHGPAAFIEYGHESGRYSFQRQFPHAEREYIHRGRHGADWTCAVGIPGGLHRKGGIHAAAPSDTPHPSDGRIPVNRLLSVVQGQESVAETLFDKCKGFDTFSVKTLALLIVILLCI